MEKEKELQEKKPGNRRLKMTLGILILAALFLVELYLMLNYFNSYLFLGVVGLAILCCIYWVTDLSFKIHNDRENALEREFENLYKAQKVSYVTLKQGFSKLEEIMDDLGDDLAFPSEEVMQTQKAIGRVTIQKNKETLETVIESNEKLMERLAGFEDKIAEIGSRMDALQEEMASPKQEQGPDRQQEIMDLLRQMDADSRPVSERWQEMMDALSNIESMIRQSTDHDGALEYQQEIMDFLTKMEISMKNETSRFEENMEAKMNEISSAVQEESTILPEELDTILNEASLALESVLQDDPESDTKEEISEEIEAVSEAVEENTEILPEEPKEEETIIPAESEDVSAELNVDELSVWDEPKAAEDEAMSENIGLQGIEMPEELTIPAEESGLQEIEMPEEIEIPEEIAIPI